MGHRRPPLIPLLAVALAVALGLAHRDAIRARAEVALGEGMPPREAALARGFVLGEDERIDSVTVEDFRRSGLSHLLAVSGQNVALLAMLAMPLLALLGLPLRARLAWVLGLIALYVPLAGAGASIVRAGVMGALTVLATLAGRRTSRFHALVVAAVLTLGIEPRFASDVGWQLSFAAVLGILLLAAPLRASIEARIGRRGWRRAAAEGAAMTIAATLATAPLIAFHFESVSTTTLVANLLALPAVAPAMGLGMLSAAAGQLPGLPVAPLNALEAPLLAYIAAVAACCGRPSWAYLHVRLGPMGLIGTYLALGGLCVAIMRRRRAHRPVVTRGSRLQRRRPLRLLGGAAIGAILVASTGLGGAGLHALDGGSSGPPSSGLRVEILDVGQGDAILLQPAGAEAVLVDGGPPGDALAYKLRAAGVQRLGAAVVTHDQADHAGGIADLLGAVPIDGLLYAMLDRRMLAEARADGARPRRVAGGTEVRDGALRLDVIWPPRELLAAPSPGEDPNSLALVMVARWRDFSMLLTADAEAQSTPIDPGPVDVLKVAHHGSDDSGLGELLDRIRPKLAVISVGSDNPYGHPTQGTLATLAEKHVQTLRTDRAGTVTLDVHRDSVRVVTEN